MDRPTEYAKVPEGWIRLSKVGQTYRRGVGTKELHSVMF